MKGRVVDNSVKAKVLLAFHQAQERGENTVDCYMGAIAVVQQMWPSAKREYAAKVAIQIVLDERAPLLMGFVNG